MPSWPSANLRAGRWADALTAAIVGAAFACRLPSITEPIGIDQGIFLTTGWGMTRGLALYGGVWDQKPPAIHLTYAAAIAIAGPHPSIVFWLDLLAALATCGFVYALARRISTPLTARASAIAYAVLMFPAARYGYGGFLERAVPECFIAPLAAAAWWLLATRGQPPGPRRIAGAAVLVGIAALYKPTAVLYLPAMLVWLRSRHPIAWKSAALAVAALLVPALLIAAWLASRGSLTDAWVAVVEYNRAYVIQGSGPIALLDRLAHEVWRLTKVDPLWTLGMLGAAVAAADVARRRPATAAWLGFCWLAVSIVAAGANGIRMYSTYFIPAGAPLALLAGWLFNRIAEDAEPRRRGAGTLAAIGLALGVAIHSHYPERLWSTVAADFHARQATGDELFHYLERFGGYRTGRGYSARANAELAAYIAQHTAADQRVYVFGMAPSVYFLAQRLPASRFIWTYPGVTNIVGRHDFTPEALAASLALSRPEYIVLERNNRDSISGWRSEVEFTSPGMQHLLGEYAHDVDIEDFMLYRRRPRGPS